MTILRDVLAELLAMFVSDARLTAAVLALVAAAALLEQTLNQAPLIGGAVLLAGCLGILTGSVLLAARKHWKQAAARDSAI